MDPLTLVHIHHEGAGVPTDDPARYQHGGYAYGIGPTRWTRIRSPYENWATYGYNHVDVTICLSGNRMVVPVTDHDIEMIRQCCADARNRDELVDTPDVVPHRLSPGSSTVCPGDRTMERWADVRAACIVPVVVKPPPKGTVVAQQYDPPLPPIVAAIACPTGGAWLAADNGAMFGVGGAPYPGGLNRSDPVSKAFAGKHVARLDPPSAANKADGYLFVAMSTDGHPYGVKP